MSLKTIKAVCGTKYKVLADRIIVDGSSKCILYIKKADIKKALEKVAKDGDATIESHWKHVDCDMSTSMGGDLYNVAKARNARNGVISVGCSYFSKKTLTAVKEWVNGSTVKRGSTGRSKKAAGNKTKGSQNKRVRR